jgi:hypothetical protein
MHTPAEFELFVKSQANFLAPEQQHRFSLVRH